MKQIIKIAFVFLFTAIAIYVKASNASDSTGNIFIYSTVLKNGEVAEYGDVLLFIQGGESPHDTVSMFISPDSALTNGLYHQIEVTEKILDSNSLHFQLYDHKRQCYYKNVDYTLSPHSKPDSIIVTYLNAMDIEFRFADSLICKIEEPIYNVNATFSDITLVYDSSALSINKQYQLDPLKSKPGVYNVEFRSKTCLSNSSQTIEIIERAKGLDFGPELNISCDPAISEFDSLISNYEFRDAGDSSWLSTEAIQANNSYIVVSRNEFCVYGKVTINAAPFNNSRLLPDTVIYCSDGYFADSLLLKDNIYIEDVPTGNYEPENEEIVVKKETGVCIEFDTVQVLLQQQDDPIKADDTLHYCELGYFIGNNRYRGIDFKHSEPSHTGPNITNGLYYLKTKSVCPAYDTAYVLAQAAVNINLPDTLNYCEGDKIITNFFNQDYQAYPANLIDTLEAVALTEISNSGYYTIKSTNGCSNFKSVHIEIHEVELIDIVPDTLRFCSNTFRFDSLKKNDAEIITIETNEKINENDLDDGLYVYKTNNGFCPGYDTTYITRIKEIPIDFEVEEFCDSTVVKVRNISSNRFKNVEMAWSSGDMGNLTSVKSSKELVLEAKDPFGCITRRSYNVEFYPLIVEDVSVEKQNADCWNNGAVAIENILLNQSRRVSSYQLKNTLTDSVLTNLENINEGAYVLQVTDNRNCITNVDTPIIVEQECLKNYPVFTPNSDGVEDSYFIPDVGLIKIYDRSGSLIKSIESPSYWDGTDKKGNLVPMGNYLMVSETGKIVNITIVR